MVMVSPAVTRALNRSGSPHEQMSDNDCLRVTQGAVCRGGMGHRACSRHGRRVKLWMSRCDGGQSLLRGRGNCLFVIRKYDMVRRLWRRPCESDTLVCGGGSDAGIQGRRSNPRVTGHRLADGAGDAVVARAIEKIHAGELWIDRLATSRLFVTLAQRKAAQDENPELSKIATLTRKELKTVVEIARDGAASSDQIAERLPSSEPELCKHLTAIYAKLGVSNRLGLFAYATRNRLGDT